jgi:hydrogenase-1 operon protein HyaF
MSADGAGPRHFPPLDMARAIAREIAELLAGVAAGGEGGAIDLRSLPMAPEDAQRLEALLGTGEVTAVLDVGGRSEIRETGHAGVWWVRHFDLEGQPQTEQIVVARIPDILCADPHDMGRAALALADAVAAASETPEGGDHGRA